MTGLELALWIATGVLAAVYVGTGAMKLLAPAKAQATSPVLAAVPRRQLQVIGALEVLGAIGVLVPPVTGERFWVAAVAAGGLALVQVLAIPRHVRMKDTRMLWFNSLLLALALFVLLGRSGAIP